MSADGSTSGQPESKGVGVPPAWLREAWPFLVLAGFSLFVMRDALLPGRVLFGHDLMAVFFDMRVFGFRSMAEGTLPLWNPYVLCGTPFVAALQSALFYPLNVLFLLTPTYWAVSISVLMHLFIAASGMHLFVRVVTGSRLAGLISGVSFAFSGFYVAKILAGHLPPVLVMAWVPALVLCGELFMRRRHFRWAVAAGAVLGVQALAGHPMHTALSGFLLLVYVATGTMTAAAQEKGREIVARSVLFLAVCAVLGFGLGAVQVLPAAGLLGNTNRTPPDRIAYVTIQSFPPENLLTFLVPGAFGYYTEPWVWAWPQAEEGMPRYSELRKKSYWGRGYYWEVFPYFGVVPLLLAAVAVTRRKDRVFWSLAAAFLIGLLIAFGKYSPPPRWLFALVARAGALRCPGRFLLLCTFAGSGLAGLGAAHVLDERRTSNRRSLQIIALLVAAALGVCGVFLIRLSTPAGQEAWTRGMRAVVSLREATEGAVTIEPRTEGFARAMFLGSAWTSWGMAAAWTLAIWMAMGGRGRRRGAVAALAVLTALDLANVANMYVLGMDSSLLMWPPNIVRFLKENLGPHRLSTLASGPHASRAAYYQIPSVGGYDAFTLRRYSELLNKNQGGNLDEPVAGGWVSEFTPIARLMGVKFVLVPSIVRIQLPDPVLDEKGLSVREIPDPCPRVFVAHDYMVEANRERALDIMSREGFDPKRTVLLEREPEIPIGEPGDGVSEAEVLDEGPNRVRIRARLLSNGVLVLTDTFYPAWRARVNGKPWRIVHADWAFRGLVLPAGEYEIEFSFRRHSLYAGVGLSAFTLLLIVALLVRAGAGRRGTGMPAPPRPPGHPEV